MAYTQPKETVFLIFRSLGRPASPHSNRPCSSSIGSTIVTPQTRAMDRQGRTSSSLSRSPVLPKFWMILATGLRVTKCRSLCASWKYSTTEPSLFFRFVFRAFVNICLRNYHVFVALLNTKLLMCVPTNVDVPAGITC